MAIVIDLIKIRRSYTPSYRPPTDVNDNKRLTDGELCINVPDGVIRIGTKTAPGYVEFRNGLPDPATLPTTSGADANTAPRWYMNGSFLCFG